MFSHEAQTLSKKVQICLHSQQHPIQIKLSSIKMFRLCITTILGADVVLAKVLVQPDNRVPDHQLIGRLKHTPGSGILSLKCSSDGPTRVLTITDENKKVFLVTIIIINILIVGLYF